jgi:arylsulfatase A-like enzyme
LGWHLGTGGDAFDVADLPNILLLITDQQRGDCLGIEDHPVLQTPNLDYLGRSGTHFRRAYSECPSCIPARRVLMSGQAPAVNGMVGFQNGVDWEPGTTLAGELTRAGYQTEMVGKLHLWPQRKRYGFEYMSLADSTRGLNNDYLAWLGGAVPVERWAMAHGATPNGWIGRPSHLPELQTHSFWCVGQAIQFLARRDPTQPFFLNVSFIDPHPPLTPPPFYFDRYVNRELPPPVVGNWAPRFDEPVRGLDPEGRDNGQRLRLDDAAMHACRAGYYGLINHVDMQIGRLLQYLRDARLLDDTWIVFTSDHGEMLGDHNLFGKTRPFEASARVPLLIRPPSGIALPRGQVSLAPVGLQDVLPTLLEIASAPIPPGVTGRSLLPLMHGDEAGWREVLHGEHAGTYRYEDGMHFLVDRRTKYVWYSQTGEELLFDLERDPLELCDLARREDNAERLAQWRARLATCLRHRPEGFVIGNRLVVGRPHTAVMPYPQCDAGAPVGATSSGAGAEREGHEHRSEAS